MRGDRVECSEGGRSTPANFVYRGGVPTQPQLGLSDPLFYRGGVPTQPQNVL